MNTSQPTGKVILAAAGPGDPELITWKAVRYLQQADVVLTDRLVSEDILREHVSSTAEIVYVGKQCSRGSSTPQQTINDLMAQHALAGKLVVRLKGGDVSVFSNILDELQTLVEYGIPYEIVPGVTAALGAAAYAGIPLTARGYATAVRFLTCYKNDIIPDEYWKELATTDDTLVFYMSSETLGLVISRLQEHHVAADRKIAVIEQATTPLQHVHTCDIYGYAEQLGAMEFVSPSLVIIGRVVDLHRQFAWFTESNNREHYFKPMAKTGNIHSGPLKSTAHATRA